MSLVFYLVLKDFNGVSRKLKGCLKFQWSFKEVSRMFQGSCKGVLRKNEGCFMQVSWIGSFKGVSRMF